MFRRIEYIRSTSVDRYRGVITDEAVDPGLGALTQDEALDFVRGFMLFSMLANLAEDRQGGATELGDNLAEAVDILAGEGIGADKVADLLDHALIMPVLTAHPTEVRRKSMIDHKNRVADLMRMRDAGRSETPDGEPVEEAIARQIALLWLTRPLRRERLFVADEIEIALSYLRDIFVPVLPLLYSGWERLLGRRVPSFLRIGSWVGGDRDGNPNVTAETLRLALGRSAEAILLHYLDEVHGLGAELSISSELAEAAPELLELAASRSRPVASPRRRTLPPGDQWHLCAARGKLRGDHWTRAAASVEPPSAAPTRIRNHSRGTSRSSRTRSARMEAGCCRRTLR